MLPAMPMQFSPPNGAVGHGGGACVGGHARLPGTGSVARDEQRDPGLGPPQAEGGRRGAGWGGCGGTALPGGAFLFNQQLRRQASH